MKKGYHTIVLFIEYVLLFNKQQFIKCHKHLSEKHFKLILVYFNRQITIPVFTIRLTGE